MSSRPRSRLGMSNVTLWAMTNLADGAPGRAPAGSYVLSADPASARSELTEPIVQKRRARAANALFGLTGESDHVGKRGHDRGGLVGRHVVRRARDQAPLAARRRRKNQP